MTILLASSTATGATATEGDVKTFLDNLRTVIAEFLGTDTANKTTALATLQALFNGSATKTAAYSIVAADRGKTIIATGTGGWTLTLTAAATLGDGFVFAVVNNTSGVITIDPNLSETINGATTYAVQATETVIVYCDGTKFMLFGKAPAQIVNTLHGLQGALTLADLQTHTAGTKYVPFDGLGDYSAEITTASQTYVEKINMRFMQAGTFRVAFKIARTDNIGTVAAYCKLYKNGSAVGSDRSTTSQSLVAMTEDVTVNAGDTVQLFIRTSAGAYPARLTEVAIGTADSPIMLPFVALVVGQR